MTSESSFDTRAVHAGRSDLRRLGVSAPPVDLSTTYPIGDLVSGGRSYEALASGIRLSPGDSPVYSRLWNPTVARFEDALADLEQAEEAVAFATGMAALTACLLAAVKRGQRHVVAVRPLYGGSDHLLACGLLGTEVTWATAQSAASSVRPDTGLVVVETPANPTVELLDIAALRAAVGDVAVLVDNTFATPVLQRPLEHGATLVLHSATKYLGGHGDVMGGVVATDASRASELRAVRAITGALLHPLAAYELHRGLQTLATRVRAQQIGAEKLAGWLTSHPAVDEVFYPGLPGRDPLGLVGRQQSGPGGVLALTLRGGFDAAHQVTSACRLLTHAVSLGSVDSLIQHPAALTHRPVSADARPPASLLRISVGLEDPADLIADLETALSSLEEEATSRTGSSELLDR